jgi:hypothetical protein
MTSALRLNPLRIPQLSVATGWHLRKARDKFTAKRARVERREGRVKQKYDFPNDYYLIENVKLNNISIG